MLGQCPCWPQSYRDGACARALANTNWPVNHVRLEHHFERLRIKENMLNHWLDYVRRVADARTDRYEQLVDNVRRFSNMA